MKSSPNYKQLYYLLKVIPKYLQDKIELKLNTNNINICVNSSYIVPLMNFLKNLIDIIKLN